MKILRLIFYFYAITAYSDEKIVGYSKTYSLESNGRCVTTYLFNPVTILRPATADGVVKSFTLNFPNGSTFEAGFNKNKKNEHVACFYGLGNLSPSDKEKYKISFSPNKEKFIDSTRVNSYVQSDKEGMCDAKELAFEVDGIKYSMLPVYGQGIIFFKRGKPIGSSLKILSNEEQVDKEEKFCLAALHKENKIPKDFVYNPNSGTLRYIGKRVYKECSSSGTNRPFWCDIDRSPVRHHVDTESKQIR